MIFLFLDLLNPFTYHLYTEFLFLGIIFLALNYPIFSALALSILSGYLKDALAFNSMPLNLIEFPCITALIYYFTHRFNKKIVKIIVIFTAILLHICFNSIISGNFNFIFSIGFFTHSSIIFSLVNYLLKKWDKPLSIDYI